jgi:hypothetical protein
MIGANALLIPGAHANEGVDSGSWDSGYGTRSCTSGINSRTCTYEFTDNNCQEASVATGTGATVAVSCDVHFKGSVTVQPRLNAAGQVVGCTSVVGTASGSITFDSSVSTDFDRTASNPIPLADLTVQSAHPDQKTAAVKFTGAVTNGTYVWTASGTMTATCARSNSSSTNTVAGTVLVALRTQQS